MKDLKKIHGHMITNDLQREGYALEKLLSFCAVSPLGDLDYGFLVFNQIQEPNRFMWNTIIRGFSNSPYPKEAFFLYKQMLNQGLFPNNFTFPFVLKACTQLSSIREGKIVHTHITKLGFTCQIVVQNALLHTYVASGSIPLARQLFDEITHKNIISWNSMIGGYSQQGHVDKALEFFTEMENLGIEPDEITIVSMLSVCSQTGDLEFGRSLHFCIAKKGQPQEKQVLLLLILLVLS
ncbi:hypothetical protein AMTR_s00059p00175950 [Amborella trichopoda]|uniref:Pentatricopeptide repeat-containing protein n=1 Tax=Amborella trichopoda TaxID=13333 RepID=U5DB64_AMBTC|nr:hypothetical protein AMTR_s00059p00175950 [Amborella trichopoda]